MGLFDKRDTTKKKQDDFDSPVEQIDLSAAPVAATPAPSAVGTGTTSAAPEAVDDLEDRRAPEPAPSRYGINDAIELMRALPSDNVELVVQVVKRTLESTNVKVQTIIEDASAKQKRIEDRIAVLKGEIGDFEKEIETRRGEIGTLESDHEETSTVKERLLLAEKLAPVAKSSGPGRNEGGTGTSSRPPEPPSATAARTTIVAKK